MQLTPEQQNRHLAVAITVCFGAALMMGLLMAWMSRSLDALVTVLILIGLFVLVEAVYWVRAAHRRDRLKHESRNWLNTFGPDDFTE